MSWNSMSGAGDSETPSVSSSRKVRSADGKVRRHVECRQHGRDQIVIVGREDAEGSPTRSRDRSARSILDVPGFLVRARLVETAARQEGGYDRIVARAAGRRTGPGAWASAAIGCAGSGTSAAPSSS